MNKFKILAKDGQARLSQLTTAHGIIETPNFIPVGTQATVKALSPKDLKAVGAQVVLANTYHLMLRPGVEIIHKLGGLHQFMSWDKPVMTDSGGFQVFSLGIGLEHGVGKLLKEEDRFPAAPHAIEARARLNKLTEEGVEFQSHLDGSKQILTPEKSIDLQLKLGADLIVSFDDLESPKHSYEDTLRSLELTERWEQRSLQKFNQLTNDRSMVDYPPTLYGVTHGGVFKDLRVRSAKFVDQNFEAIALGGAHKDRPTLYQVVEWTTDNVDSRKPRHLLGIGEVEDLFNCVYRGIDLFDCAGPSRRARNGSLYISPLLGFYNQKSLIKNNFSISITLSKFTDDSTPIDLNCNCYTCENFSRAYLRHLYLAKELLYYQLATIHNIYFIENLMAQIRQSIKRGEFGKLKKEWLGS